MRNSSEILGHGIDINHIIDVFYNKMVKDDRLRDFFTIVDLTAVKRKQANFFATLLSDDTEGVHSYMLETHRELVEDFGLNDDHFDALYNILAKTFTQEKVDPSIGATLLEKLEDLRPCVLGK